MRFCESSAGDHEIEQMGMRQKLGGVGGRGDRGVTSPRSEGKEKLELILLSGLQLCNCWYVCAMGC